MGGHSEMACPQDGTCHLIEVKYLLALQLFVPPSSLPPLPPPSIYSFMVSIRAEKASILGQKYSDLLTKTPTHTPHSCRKLLTRFYFEKRPCETNKYYHCKIPKMQFSRYTAQQTKLIPKPVRLDR